MICAMSLSFKMQSTLTFISPSAHSKVMTEEGKKEVEMKEISNHQRRVKIRSPLIHFLLSIAPLNST